MVEIAKEIKRGEAMKNKFEIRGNVTVIFLQYKGQETTTTISTEDLNRVSSITGRWYAMNVGGKRGEKIYVGTKIGGVTVYLHQIIVMNPPKMVVDHVNHNTLDNTRENLRACSYAENSQNRKGATRSNKSTGVRNVYRSSNGKFFVQLGINGKDTRFGTFPTILEAKAAAKLARKEYFPISN